MLGDGTTGVFEHRSVARAGVSFLGRIDNFGRTTRFFRYGLAWVTVDCPAIEYGRHEADYQRTAD